MKDYYSFLDIDRNATQDDIKKAYKKLVMKHHPDRFPNAEEKKKAEMELKKIQEAYAVLSDEQKRKQYDSMGHDAYGQFGSQGGSSGGFDFNGEFDFQDILNSFFGGSGAGGSRSASGRVRGEDLRIQVEISLEEAFQGCKKTINIPKSHKCGTCKGDGIDHNKEVKTCQNCKGRGVFEARQLFFSFPQKCAYCAGQGKVYHPCKDCSGKGVINKKTDIDIEIPKGIMHGMDIKFPQQGNAGHKNGQNGDLFVNIKIKKNSIFSVEQSNLHLLMHISVTQAVLGTEIEVPTIDGEKVSIKVKPGTQSFDKISVAKKGMPMLGSSQRGDLILTVEVEIPSSLSKEQRELWELLAQKTESKKASGFWHSVSEYLKKRFM
jgi:molecular chaperone DnaJ